ncbi:MAG: stage II sporulation protein E, partial [Holophaga sp.]|nr:stage II sporulation protein E [Holophaga sp.]
ILGRELGRTLSMDLRNLDPDVPPISRMDGFDLVTEGAITLARMVRLLEDEESPDLLKPNAATQLAGILLDSDIIHIVAGTKINEALQDPSLPEDLDIRRNILRGLKKVLTEKFLKEVRIRFI